MLGIVGESGSGKSVTSMAILGLLAQDRADHRIESTSAATSCSAKSDRSCAESPRQQDRDGVPGRARGAEPGVHRRRPDRRGDHGAPRRLEHGELHERVVELLDLVGIPNPRTRADQYPHEYSGGMRQRAMIAMSIANEPDVLIADEPTTALDVTIQAQVLEVLERIQDRTRSADHADHPRPRRRRRRRRPRDGDVRRAGRSSGRRVDDVFYAPRHPYTLGLLASLPASRPPVARRTAVPHQGPAAVAHPRAVRVRVPPAVPARVRTRRCLHTERPELAPGRGTRRTTSRRATSQRSLNERFAAIGRSGIDDGSRPSPCSK